MSMPQRSTRMLERRAARMACGARTMTPTNIVEKSRRLTHFIAVAFGDREEIGGRAVASPYQYTFKMKSMAPTKATKGGEIRIVDSRNFPVNKHVAAPLTNE